MPLIILGIVILVGVFFSWKVALCVLAFFLLAIGSALER